jgi:hypothetical protein
MDTKLTLSLDTDVIASAKKYAAANNISLSKLIEFLLTKVTSKEYRSLEDYPIAEWVQLVAEGPVEYQTAKRTRKRSKDQFFSSKK